MTSIDFSKVKVGQILYVYFSETNIIYPLQVIEEITRKSISGVEIDFQLKAGSKDNFRIISLKDIKETSTFFVSHEDAFQFLLEHETEKIKKNLADSIEKAKRWYGEEQNTGDDKNQ